jgi:hypothetical protein
MSNKEPQKVRTTREINFKHNSYSLLRAPVVFHNLSKFALIDTGASASFISDEYLCTIPEEAIIRDIENVSERVFRSASGETMRITGMFEIKVKLSPECTINQVFYVLPKLEEECILGIDFLHANQISLDVANKEMKLGLAPHPHIIKLNRISKNAYANGMATLNHCNKQKCLRPNQEQRSLLL